MRTPTRLRIVTRLLPLALALACAPAQPPHAATDASTGIEGQGTSTGAVGEGPSADGPSSSTGPDPSTGETTRSDSSSTVADATGPTVDDTGPTVDDTGPAPGLGLLSGECGLIDALELDLPSPFTFENAIDFHRLGFDYDLLTLEGQQVFDAGNLGGSSLHSEVVSFEVLARCEGASLLATEGEIAYLDPMGTKTDLLVEIDGRTVGVSVTRAVGFPFDAPYTELHATTLLSGKLADILVSSANVAPRDAWVKQILHVIAYADMHAQSIFAAYATLPPELTVDTILLVTVTHGEDGFVY